MQPIVSVEWLRQHLGEPDIQPLFVMGLKKTKEELAAQETAVQIPGSNWFDLKTTFLDTSAALPNTVPSAEDFQRNCQELGINKDTLVVLYDDNGVYSSPRAWWLFRLMGHDKVVVLNGGLPAWQEAGGPTVAFHQPTVKKGDFIATLQKDRIQYTDTILQNMEDQEMQVLDARSRGRFDGTEPEPREGMSSGHIPGSKSLPFTDVIQGGKFKSYEELKTIFRELELDDKPLVFSCGSGITACIDLLAAEQVLDQPKSVYDGSWTEWASTEGLPIAKNT